MTDQSAAGTCVVGVRRRRQSALLPSTVDACSAAAAAADAADAAVESSGSRPVVRDAF